MRIWLYIDNTLPLALAPLCDILNSVCNGVTFVVGSTRFRVTTPTISSPATYDSLPASLEAEAQDADLAVLATTVPYENNYFFDAKDRYVIISFSGWNTLTDLPISNGLVYFLASLLVGHAGVGESHDDSTGCVNDFWWDKRGVDLGMRAAFICERCLSEATDDNDLAVLADIHSLLDAVSRASRANVDLLTIEVAAGIASSPTAFDVFLCHNNSDKPAVRQINQAMLTAGLRTWLDEEQLSLGIPWQAELESQIANVKAAAVCVGDSGLGPWQNAEMRAFLNEFATRGCPVIPVILPGAPAVPQLPVFLKQMTWVDLRQDASKGLDRLIKALHSTG